MTEKEVMIKRAEREIKATDIRERLINEMSTEEKIKILFAHFIRNARPEDVIKIGDEFLRKISFKR